MGVYKFARKIFKVDFNKSIYYIISIAIMTAFIFNAINISYNDSLYLGSNEYVEVEETIQSYVGENEVRIIEMPVKVVQKRSLFILLISAAFFGIFSNINHIKRKGKEIAFMLSNGASLIDISRYLIFINGINYIIGTVIGLAFGLMLIPVFNKTIYILSGAAGPLFTISSEALLLAIVYVFIQFSIVLILNFGYVYRREITDLFKIQKRVNNHDKRNVKTPGEIFFMVYIFAVITTVFSRNIAGGEHAANVLSYVGTIGLYGVVKYFIPKVTDKLKKSEFMFKGNRRVFVSNFQKTLSNSIIYLLGTIIILNYFLSSIVEYYTSNAIVASSVFGIIGGSIIISLSLIYNLLVESGENINIYNQLRILGYKKKEITNILYKESILFFILGLSLALILNFSALQVYVSKGIISVSLGITIIIVELIPLLIAGIISTVLNKKKVIETVYRDSNKTMVVIA
ncbi:FtsX-like permease family protein [Clostridium paraputrificum]|uniref:FtsX-like permease family protein n=1 Tax=Clostridium paraputrificum TaxID=29363 RepID=UPI003D346C8C